MLLNHVHELFASVGQLRGRVVGRPLHLHQRGARQFLAGAGHRGIQVSFALDGWACLWHVEHRVMRAVATTSARARASRNERARSASLGCPRFGCKRLIIARSASSLAPRPVPSPVTLRQSAVLHSPCKHSCQPHSLTLFISFML